MHAPAWSASFAAPTRREVVDDLPAGAITRPWAWGGSTGQGVRVAILDTGVDNEHPAVGSSVTSWAAFTDVDGEVTAAFSPHTDSLGHGTACAGLVHAIAPEAQLCSVKVMGSLGGKVTEFAAGLRWAIDARFDVINLSLGTTRRDFAPLFHELVDAAYFRGLLLVTAANNRPETSYPSLYASVISVAAHEGSDPLEFYYNPAPPVEFGARGINVRVAWTGHRDIVATGNSFAAPHIAGIAALIRAKHPTLSPFQIKTVLRATAANVRRSARQPRVTASSAHRTTAPAG